MAARLLDRPRDRRSGSRRIQLASWWRSRRGTRALQASLRRSDLWPSSRTSRHGRWQSPRVGLEPL